MRSGIRHKALLLLGCSLLAVVVAACGGEDTSESTSIPTLPVKSAELYNPDETEAGELDNLSQETPASDQQDAGTATRKQFSGTKERLVYLTAPTISNLHIGWQTRKMCTNYFLGWAAT